MIGTACLLSQAFADDPANTDAIKGLNSTDLAKYAQSIDTLVASYSQDKSIVLGLFDRQDDSILNALTSIVGRVGKPAVEDLARIFPTASKSKRERILDVLGSLRGFAKPALPCLHSAVTNPSSHDKVQIIETIGLIGDRSSIDTLIRTLREKDDDIRFATLQVFVSFKEDAFPALNDLLAILKTEKCYTALRDATERVIPYLGPKILPQLKKNIEDQTNDRLYKRSLIAVLGEISQQRPLQAEDVRVAVAILTSFEKHSDNELREPALESIWRLVRTKRDDNKLEGIVSELWQNGLKSYSESERIRVGLIAGHFRAHRRIAETVFIGTFEVRMLAFAR